MPLCVCVLSRARIAEQGEADVVEPTHIHAHRRKELSCFVLWLSNNRVFYVFSNRETAKFVEAGAHEKRR